VAAGNFHDNACNYSPARVLSTLSVASSSIQNTISWFSNYGICTSIIAPVSKKEQFLLKKIN